MKSIYRLLASLIVLISAGCTSAPRHPVSDHFDGEHFFGPVADHSFTDMVRWLWEMETVDWPNWIEDPPQPKPLPRVTGRQIRVTYINHATLLIQLNGFNLLTDPIWSDRAGPFSWFGTPRVRMPGVNLDDLPPIDAILISHNHYDHLDLPTLEAIARRQQPTVFVGLGLKAVVEEAGLTDVRELDWWERASIGALTIEFVPAQHKSGRGLFDGNKTLWGGFVIAGQAGRIYFAGDTGYGAFIDELASRHAPFDVTLLPLGNYEKRWFMKNQHMNPDDAVRAHLALRSRQSIGMHFGTFKEHPEQAIEAHETDLAAALSRQGVAPPRFIVPGFGQALAIDTSN